MAATLLSACATEQKAPPAKFSRDPYPSTYRAYPGAPTLLRNATVLDGAGGRIDGVDAGGAEFLATALRLLAEEVQRPDTITVAAGDLIGASPLLSAAFHDEPTIEALGLTGLDLASVGNHEFDEGADELLRIQNGGGRLKDGSQWRIEIGPHREAGLSFGERTDPYAIAVVVTPRRWPADAITLKTLRIPGVPL